MIRILHVAVENLGVLVTAFHAAGATHFLAAGVELVGFLVGSCTGRPGGAAGQG